MTINNQIIIVSGLPRSGTSMLMKILERGGIDILQDKKRESDIDNPGGYYEHEAVKNLGKNNKWIVNAVGQALKVVSLQLEFLPLDLNYKIIFVDRNLDEVLLSQEKMQFNRKSIDKIKNEEMLRYYRIHLIKIKRWLLNKDNFDTLYLRYDNIIKSPGKNINLINNFLGNILDIKQASKVVNPSLYRNRVD